MSITDLPTLNASLNALCTVLLIVAYVHIRAKRVAQHRRMMLAAFTTSVLFLISYVTYHAQIGSKPFQGTGLMRLAYFTILIPHVILAAAVVPMALVTLRRGLRRDDARHRAIARWTFPIWLFVSVTGVIVYLMLYWTPTPTA
jgi:putative membrane protein